MNFHLCVSNRVRFPTVLITASKLSPSWDFLRHSLLGVLKVVRGVLVGFVFNILNYSY